MTSTPLRWTWRKAEREAVTVDPVERRDLEHEAGHVSDRGGHRPLLGTLDAFDREDGAGQLTGVVDAPEPLLGRAHRQGRVGDRPPVTDHGVDLAEHRDRAGQGLGRAMATQPTDVERLLASRDECRHHRTLEVAEHLGHADVCALDAPDRHRAGDDQHLIRVERRMLGLPQRVGLVPASDVRVDDGNEGHGLARAPAHLDEEGDVRGMQQRGLRIRQIGHEAFDGRRSGRRRIDDQRRPRRSRPRRAGPGALRNAGAVRRNDPGASRPARRRPRSVRATRARSVRRTAGAGRHRSCRPRRRSTASRSGPAPR